MSLVRKLFPVIYPSNCKEIDINLPLDELVSRLDCIARAFQKMSQEDNHSEYYPLALYLSNDFFLTHADKNVRLIVACSIADLFRLYAPSSPFKEPETKKRIFPFLIDQLKELGDTKNPNYERYCYLLENLVWVQSFNLCFELDNYQDIFYKLFEMIFDIIHYKHRENIERLFFDLLSPYISGINLISNDLMKLILNKLIESKRNNQISVFKFTWQIISNSFQLFKRQLPIYLQNILTESSKVNNYNNGQQTQKISLSKKNNKKLNKIKRDEYLSIFDIIVDLQNIDSELIKEVLPMIRTMLTSEDEDHRKECTKLAGLLFSRNPELYHLQNSLWLEFLKRFSDVSASIRSCCVQYSMHFLINNPQLKTVITEQLKLRKHDKDENIRYQVVLSIISAAKSDIKYINKELLSFVIDRTRDIKFKIRKEALLGLGQLYKQYILIQEDKVPHYDEEIQQTLQLLLKFENKCMLNYFQESLEDKLLIEKIFDEYLVPITFPLSRKMKALYIFYCSLDNTSAKAFSEILRQKQQLRKIMRELVDMLLVPPESRDISLFNSRISLVAKNFTKNVIVEECIQQFITTLDHNETLKDNLYKMLTAVNHIYFDTNGNFMEPPKIGKIEEINKEIIKILGLPLQTNCYYVTIKELIDRASPTIIDNDGLVSILDFIYDSLIGDGNKYKAMKLENSPKKGLELIHTISKFYPTIFYGKDLFEFYFLPFLWQTEDNDIIEIVLKILINVAKSSISNFEERNCNRSIVYWADKDGFIEQLINKFILNAKTEKQAKLAVKCLNYVFNNEEEKKQTFGRIIDKIKDTKMSLQTTQNLRFYLISLGQIIINGGNVYFPKIIGSIIRKYIVCDLLLIDSRTDDDIKVQQSEESSKNLQDYDSIYDSLSIEVKTKITAIKLLVKWIQGLKLNTFFSEDANNLYTSSVLNSFRLLRTIIKNEGDINGRGHAGTIHEKACLRLAAALAMLKISSFDALNSIDNNHNEYVFDKYSVTLDIMHPTQWHTLAMCLLDKEAFVCDIFLSKLHKHLFNLNLTLEFMAILSLGGIIQDDALKKKTHASLIKNIHKRREILNSKVLNKNKAIVPEYALPYVVHLLANVPFYPNYSPINSPELEQVQACIWFILEPFVNDTENFSFTFFKRTFDNIKLCVDRCGESLLKKNPEAQDQVNNTNMKIYCICDLALGLIMSKAKNFISKEMPIEPTLPAKYYSASLSQNTLFRSYLPENIKFNVPKRCQLEEEVLGKVPHVRFASNYQQTIIRDNDNDCPANKKLKT